MLHHWTRLWIWWLEEVPFGLSLRGQPALAEFLVATFFLGL